MASRTTDILIEGMSGFQESITIEIAREEEAEIAIRDAKMILENLGAQRAIESDYGVKRRGEHIVVFDTFSNNVLLKRSTEGRGQHRSGHHQQHRGRHVF